MQVERSTLCKRYPDLLGVKGAQINTIQFLRGANASLFFIKYLESAIYLERRVRDSNPKDFYIQTVFKTAPSTNRTHGMNVVYRTRTYAPNKR